jgi:glycosyltransferase involved in cell wall biosynthesis
MDALNSVKQIKYGLDLNSSVDVTNIVIKKCRASPLSKVNIANLYPNALFGDKFPNRKKLLIILLTNGATDTIGETHGRLLISAECHFIYDAKLLCLCLVKHTSNPDSLLGKGIRDTTVMVQPKTIHIYLITHALGVTGAPRVMYGIYDTLAEAGYKVTMIVPRKGVTPPYPKDMPPFEICEIKHIGSKIRRECSTSSLKPVVFCNSLITGKYVQQLVNKDIIIYWIIHESKNWFRKTVKRYRFLIQSVNGMIYVCRDSAKSYSVLRQKAKYVIYNGLDLIKFDEAIKQSSIQQVPDSWFSLLGIQHNGVNDKPLIITMIGIISPNKNQSGFIKDVFNPFLIKYPNTRLLLLGRGELSTANILTSALDKIILKGEVVNVVPYIMISDIVVCYSEFEVLPLNLIESMYCEKPVVSKNIGGISEIVTHGHDGFLIQNKDEMFSYLELLTNPDLRNRIGKAAREKVICKFDAKKNNQAYLEIIKSLS